MSKITPNVGDAMRIEVREMRIKNKDLWALLFKYNQAISDQLKKNCEAIWNGKERCWLVAPTEENAKFLSSAFGLKLPEYRQPEKRLALGDLLKPGHEKALAPHLAAAARRWAGLDKTEALDTVFFVENNTIPLTDNVGILDKGLVFNYVPYEIGSYAMGEVRLFVPFSDIQQLLK